MRPLLDQVSGRIDRVALFYSAEAAAPFAEAFQSVFQALAGRARLAILCHGQVRTRLQRALEDAGCAAEIVSAPDNLSFSVWARDALIALQGGRLLIPKPFARYDDHAAARLLAEGVGLDIVETDLPLEGGNLIAAAGHLMLGADLTDAVEGRAPLLKALAGNRRVLDIGFPAPLPGESQQPGPGDGGAWMHVIDPWLSAGTRQPAFHIDLFLAAAGHAADGRPRLMIGCPRIGAQAMGQPLPGQARAERFDQMAEGLAEAGFEVHRCPMPCIGMAEAKRKRITWVHLPYPNVWVAEDEVFLPQFAHPSRPRLADCDRAAAEAWASLGFRVHRLGGFLPLAENGGGLNCLGNVLARRSGAAEPEL